MQILQQNTRHIIEAEKSSKRQATFNLRLNSLDSQEIISKLSDIFNKQTKAFKVHLAFSFVLRNNIDGTYRFYYASHNNHLLDSPVIVSNQEGFDRFIEQLAEIDFLENILSSSQIQNGSFILLQMC